MDRIIAQIGTSRAPVICDLQELCYPPGMHEDESVFFELLKNPMCLGAFNPADELMGWILFKN